MNGGEWSVVWVCGWMSSDLWCVVSCRGVCPWLCDRWFVVGGLCLREQWLVVGGLWWIVGGL